MYSVVLTYLKFIENSKHFKDIVGKSWPEIRAFVIITFVFQFVALIAACFLKKKNADVEAENSCTDQI